MRSFKTCFLTSFGSNSYTETVAHLPNKAVAGHIPHQSASRLLIWCPACPHTCIITMILCDDLDSWRNRVTIPGPALLKCCSAFHVTGEAAASARLADSWLTFLVKQPASAAPQLPPAQLPPAQLCGLSLRSFVIFSMRSLHDPRHIFLQVGLQDQNWCPSKVGYSWDRICTFIALDYNMTCFGEVTPFPEVGPILPVNTWCKWTPLAQASFTQVDWLGIHKQ